jgi:hypothetical protein
MERTPAVGGGCSRDFTLHRVRLQGKVGILIGRGEATVNMSFQMVVMILWCIYGLGKPLEWAIQG